MMGPRHLACRGEFAGEPAWQGIRLAAAMVVVVILLAALPAATPGWIVRDVKIVGEGVGGLGLIWCVRGWWQG